MKTTIIYFSDIHYKNTGSPENQGIVLSAFLDDVKKMIEKNKSQNVKVFIGGDLVQAADSLENYNGFDSHVIKKLITSLNIPRSNFLIAPGNHDVQRDKVQKTYTTHHNHVTSKYSEKVFNDLLESKDENGIIYSKFTNYKRYIEESFRIKINDDCSSSLELNDDWAALSINTALLSEGGYNNWNDESYLGINTRNLHRWINEHKTKKKILLMHHPNNFLLEWCQDELKTIIRNNFDLVLSGHTHSQDLLCDPKIKKTIMASSPQLFTDKYDLTLGYCFITLDGTQVEKITYRQWIKERSTFKTGIAFADDDEDHPGEVIFQENTTFTNVDRICAYYDGKLRSELKIFANQPYFWIDRFLCKERLDFGQHSFKDVSLITESDLLNAPQNVMIVSPADGGLTCYAYNFLKILRETHGEIGYYLSCSLQSLSKFQESLGKLCLELNVETSTIPKWIVLDNWNGENKICVQILDYVKTTFPDSCVMILSCARERITSTDQNIKNYYESFVLYFLTPLNRTQMRTIVEAYNQKNYIDEGDKVLKRVDDDLKNFNMHRSPFNCMTLLEVFNNSKFEEYPVNRTLVLEKVLRKIFETIEIPGYISALPNVNEVEYVVGLFCSKLFMQDGLKGNTLLLFKKDNFKNAVTQEMSQIGDSIDLDILFNVMIYSGIFVPYEDSYVFRLRTWAYYFAAVYMTFDDKFSKYVLANKRYVKYPDIIEFYTGKTQRQVDALKVTETDLRSVVKKISEKFKIRDDFNPFSFLRVKNTEEVKNGLIDSINNTIKESALPNDVKDKLLDENYNMCAPYSQNIYQDIVDYTVRAMFANIEIASKALRNTVLADKELKKKLINTILDSWSVFAKVVTLVSRDFAHQGWINIDGVGFRLVDEFNELEESDKRIEIIASIPLNIISRFVDHIYTQRLSNLLFEMLENEKDKIKKHLLASIIVWRTPDNWHTYIKRYISIQNAQSYYLIDTSYSLQRRKSWGQEYDTESTKLNVLLNTISFKIDKGYNATSLQQIYPKTMNMADMPKMPFVNKKKEVIKEKRNKKKRNNRKKDK